MMKKIIIICLSYLCILNYSYALDNEFIYFLGEYNDPSIETISYEFDKYNIKYGIAQNDIEKFKEASGYVVLEDIEEEFYQMLFKTKKPILVLNKSIMEKIIGDKLNEEYYIEGNIFYLNINKDNELSIEQINNYIKLTLSDEYISNIEVIEKKEEKHREFSEIAIDRVGLIIFVFFVFLSIIFIFNRRKYKKKLIGR